MHNPIFFSDPSGLYAIPAKLVLVVLACGAFLLVTGAYLTTPAGQDLMHSATMVLQDGVDALLGAIEGLASQAASGIANASRFAK